MRTAADPDYRRERASKAARARWHTPEHAERRAARLADHIAQVVNTAPPLTPETAERLAAILLRRSAEAPVT